MRIAILIALVLACASFLWTARDRNDIGVTEPCMSAPEKKLWGYDEADLNAFRSKTEAHVLPGGRTALDAYRHPVLVPKDLIFALCLGAFVFLLGWWLAMAYPRWRRWFMASAILGLVYAASDVAEDIVLAKILAKPVTPADNVWVASRLTQTKVATLVLSGTGIAAFYAFRGIDYLVTPKPKCGSRAATAPAPPAAGWRGAAVLHPSSLIVKMREAPLWRTSP